MTAPSSNNASNWLPSRWNSEPALKILPKTVCTIVILAPMPDLAAEPLLQIGRGRKMIRMRMRVQYPIGAQVMPFDVSRDRVSRNLRRAPGRWIEFENRVDDRAGVRLRILHHIAHRIGGHVEERLDFGMHGRLLTGQAPKDGWPTAT